MPTLLCLYVPALVLFFMTVAAVVALDVIDQARARVYVFYGRDGALGIETCKVVRFERRLDSCSIGTRC